MIIISIYIIFTVGGLILLKLGTGGMNIAMQNGNLQIGMSYISILGFIFYIISFLLYTFYIIKHYNLSYIYPIVTGLTQILVVLAGLFIFKEHITTTGVIGIGLVILGLVLLNIK